MPRRDTAVLLVGSVCLIIGVCLGIYLDGVRFLNECESAGIPVLQCSPYFSEWMQRERSQTKAADT